MMSRLFIFRTRPYCWAFVFPKSVHLLSAESWGARPYSINFGNDDIKKRPIALSSNWSVRYLYFDKIYFSYKGDRDILYASEQMEGTPQANIIFARIEKEKDYQLTLKEYSMETSYIIVHLMAILEGKSKLTMLYSFIYTGWVRNFFDVWKPVALKTFFRFL